MPITGLFRLRCFTGATLFGLMLVGSMATTSAMAHAILEQSQPPAGGSVPAGKVDMSFIYNSRIDRARSRLTLTSPDHKQTVLSLILTVRRM